MLGKSVKNVPGVQKVYVFFLVLNQGKVYEATCRELNLLTRACALDAKWLRTLKKCALLLFLRGLGHENGDINSNIEICQTYPTPRTQNK
eukprot:966195-Amphidinium_carterae.1